MLIFDIEQDEIQKLVTFFDSYGISIDAQSMHVSNHNIKAEHNQIWQQFVGKYPELAAHDNNYTEWQQIQNICNIHHM